MREKWHACVAFLSWKAAVSVHLTLANVGVN